jgi:hypothetical protein
MGVRGCMLSSGEIGVSNKLCEPMAIPVLALACMPLLSPVGAALG